VTSKEPVEQSVALDLSEAQQYFPEWKEKSRSVFESIETINCSAGLSTEQPPVVMPCISIEDDSGWCDHFNELAVIFT
jgi:hypothetical protein